MKNNYYESPKAGKLMRMFWKAAGADQYLLERSTYSDQIKYFCLGGIVLATGVMAAMAGGYAIYTIFEPKGDALDGMVTTEALKNGMKSKDFIHLPTLFISVIFGLIWGLIIYNIDRFIVTSTGKGDGTEAITRKEIISAIPRIIMGLIIALTISKPIEIRMFKSEIDAELEVIQDKKFLERKATIDLMYAERLKTENTKLEKYRAEIETKDDKLQKSIFVFNQEMDGGAGARGYGDEAKIKQNQVERDRKEYETTKKTNEAFIKTSVEKIENFNKDQYIDYKRAKQQVNALDGLLERIKLAHEVAGFWISLFITLLFVVIELTPIFFKMMLIKGPYDYMDENVKDLARAEAGIEVQYDFYKDKDGAEAHKVVNHGARIKENERLLILAAQDEINKKIIETWKKNKLQDIEQNPDAYFEEK